MAIEQYEWLTENILNIECVKQSYACILLNRPIPFEALRFQQLWNKGKQTQN